MLLVVLGLVASQASARVLRILPAPGCEASSIFPIEGTDDEVISIMPIAGETAPISVLPIAPEQPAISLPVLPAPRPVPSNKLPPSQSILPEEEVAPISFLPIVVLELQSFQLPPELLTSSHLQEKLHQSQFSPLSPNTSTFQFAHSSEAKPHFNHASCPEQPSILSSQFSSTSSSSIQQVAPSQSVLPVEEEVISILPTFPVGSNKLPPTFEIAPLPVVIPERPAVSPPIVPVAPVAPEADCEQPEAPVAPEQHIPDRYIILLFLFQPSNGFLPPLPFNPGGFLQSINPTLPDVVQDPTLYTQPSTDIIITLHDPLGQIFNKHINQAFPSRDSQISTLVAELQGFSLMSQAPILALIKNITGVDAEPFWISNQLSLKNATPSLITTLVNSRLIKNIARDLFFPIMPILNMTIGKEPEGPEWGILKINADKLWNITKGEGIVVATIDTGARHTHSSLKNNYVGAHNYGPGCNTTAIPANQKDNIAVGATDINDNLARFSSRGPNEDRNLVKPEIVAPGKDVNSAYFLNDNAYRVMSGTSMSCPLVAGAAALLLSINRNLKYEDIRDLLYETSYKNISHLDGPPCGSIPLNVYPNHMYGHGRIDVYEAYRKMVEGSNYKPDKNRYTAPKRRLYQSTYLENLDVYLTPFQNCFIHLTNHQGINIPALNAPIMLRELQPAICTNELNKTFRHMVSKSLKLSTARRNTSCDFQPCPVSALFANSTSVCVELNFQRFVIRTKPWNCELIISLFPSQLYLKPSYHLAGDLNAPLKFIPGVFEEEVHAPIRRVQDMIPSFEPINILITNLMLNSHSQNWYRSSGAGSWFRNALIQSEQSFFNNFITRQVYLVMKVMKEIKLWKSSFFSDPQYFLDRFCPTKSNNALKDREMFATSTHGAYFDVLNRIFQNYTGIIGHQVKSCNGELPITILLEQGNTFSENQLKKINVKLIVASTSLVCIVLSNAYKSDNVYEMISPRLSIKFKTFDELISAEFDIYSRINVLATKGYFYMEVDNFTGFQFKSPHVLSRYSDFEFSKTYIEIEKFDEFESEVHAIYGNHLQSFAVSTKLSAETKLLQKVLNHSKLLETTGNFIETSTYGTNNDEFDIEAFETKQEVALLERIKKCDRVALILGDYSRRLYYVYQKLIKGVKNSMNSPSQPSKPSSAKRLALA
ncbi:Membrane-bound transcription factor site-1 protease [Orchesella cincta]|uniref:Membrane-bound transcription factor site-1 protease n=1 Tax=Orchesella cincta TaxID=48709 RepID=A0A1D2M8W7_ORCCI|nr:Membrane-bound transcription factor site-1 protease [Orchesella cincta]